MTATRAATIRSLTIGFAMCLVCLAAILPPAVSAAAPTRAPLLAEWSFRPSRWFSRVLGRQPAVRSVRSVPQGDPTVSNPQQPGSQSPVGGVVNWDPPAKRDLVERAVSDGMTDSAEIVKYAKTRDLTLTVKEVDAIRAELAKKK